MELHKKRKSNKKKEEFNEDTFDESTLGKNPFINSLSIPVTKIYSDTNYVKNDEGTWLNSSFYAERTASTRIYMCPGCATTIYGLSPKAKEMFLYFLYHPNRGKDWIKFNPENYTEKTKVSSRTTITEALAELIKNGLLNAITVVPKVKNMYWINPFMFSFNNRVIAYPEKLDIKGTI